MTTPLRVLFDATAIPANRGGVGRYVDSVLLELARRDDLEVTVVCQSRDRDSFQRIGLHAVVAIAPRFERIPLRLLWEQKRLPRLARSINADVIYSPHYTFPILTRLPRTVSVWDLTFFSHPELHSRLKRAFFRAWIRASVTFKNIVATSSEATARELRRVVRMPPERVIVAPLAYSADVFHEPTPIELDDFRDALTPPVSNWVAFLGTLEPRKNVVALIEGFRAATAESDPAPALLLAGGDGWDNEIPRAIEDARAAGSDVRKLGYVPIEQLSSLLGGALVVAYPSLGEGFGLPVLEAMATGACVLTTRKLSLPEVGGDAVAYSETSAASIGHELTRLLNDPGERRRLGENARKRAQTFRWGRTADLLVEGFRRATAGAHGAASSQDQEARA